ncbi:MAG: hypothetical protein ACUVS7_15945 [Bryobacteraceae bacterium]
MVRLGHAAWPDELADLQGRIERLVPRRRWSPWVSAGIRRDPAGLGAILVEEAVAKQRVRLVYEWRGKQPMSPALRSQPGTAWIRLHESEEQAAADYLEQRAVGGSVLPLWIRTGDPPEACPRRMQADLAVAVGDGNVPSTPPELARFAEQLSRLAPVAMVEVVPAKGGVEWDVFLEQMRNRFRVACVAETGPGRRLCTLERC